MMWMLYFSERVDLRDLWRCVAHMQKAVAQSPMVASHDWPALSTRVIALSATLPNLGDIAAYGIHEETVFCVCCCTA
jgi:hypothetical protein